MDMPFANVIFYSRKSYAIIMMETYRYLHIMLQYTMCIYNNIIETEFVVHIILYESII